MVAQCPRSTQGTGVFQAFPVGIAAAIPGHQPMPARDTVSPYFAWTVTRCRSVLAPYHVKLTAVPEKTVCVVFPDAPPWKGRELEASFTFTVSARYLSATACNHGPAQTLSA